MPVSAAAEMHGWSCVLFVGGKGGKHHSGILSPTGRSFTRSNDLIIVADLHCLLNGAAACVCMVASAFL